MTVTETIRCPGCSTRFLLRPERVHAGTRRAKCFKCETIFAIGDEVVRLLAPAAPEEEILVAPPAFEPEPAPAEPPPVPPSVVDSPFAAFDAGGPSSLTLGDLEGADEEIMEKTLVLHPPPPPPLPPMDVPEPSEPSASGGYSSAKDAISKLMGNTPAPQPAGERRTLGQRSPMDVEATLSALDITLSGTQQGAAAPPPAPPAAPEPTASTMKLSAAEIQAAISSFGGVPPRPPSPPTPPPARIAPPPPRAEVPPPPRPMESRPLDPTGAPGADLLKIQMEQETLNNVTLDQMSTWIEQGRVQEYHMVARQFSDNWIEAVKVPALRPIFDRKRRIELGITELPAAPELGHPKRSLFGGLFGRN